MLKEKVLIIGGGLAGCEAAFKLAENEVAVVLYESKKNNPNPAQKLSTLAELVCTNSLKSVNETTGHGLLKFEMEKLGSLVLQTAYQAKVPAGDSLSVDREVFSTNITEKIAAHKNIELIYDEVSKPDEMLKKHGCQRLIIASGPLTTQALADWIKNNISSDDLYFYDAIAPVVDADSLNYEKLYFKDRYKDHTEGRLADYLNAPMNEDEYKRFVLELKNAQKVPARNFEEYVFFESCLPIDLMAERGEETPRFSCMKPVGLETKEGQTPYAAVQLRRENLLGDAYNLVGFQTRLTYSEQKRIFRMIPGMEKAEFIHLGSVHRNTFLNAKKLLNIDLSTKKNSKIYFAGQIMGVEGYTESAAMGLYVAYQILRDLHKQEVCPWPHESAIGALINHIMTQEVPRPTNINFGLLPRIEVGNHKRIHRSKYKNIKKEMMAKRAREVFSYFLNQYMIGL